MKILHIIPSLSKGGAERLVLDICRVFHVETNITVKLITFRGDNAYSFLTEGLDWEVVPATVIPSISGKMKAEVTALQKAIENFQPDIIHSHLFETEIVLSQINYNKAKYVVHFHSNMVQFENLRFLGIFNKKKLTNFYEKWIVLAAYRSHKTQFITISENTLQYVESVIPGSFKKIMQHNALDTNRFSPPNFQMKSERPIINTIGSLVDKKGHELAIQTVAVLKERGIDVELNILGEGKNKTKLEALIQKLKLSRNIFLRGNVDHPESFLKSSILYMHTASYEPFGLVLLEAMACGLPVVCTDGGGNRDLIQEGVNGFMVKQRDPKQLADKIELLLTDSLLRQQMGKKARVFAQQFSIEKYCKNLLDIYQNILICAV